MAEDPHVADLMLAAQRDVETRLLKAIADAGFADITIAQTRLLQRLTTGGMRLTDMAEQARVTKQTAGALVAQLEGAGYVERRPDPSDARARLVTLSARGAQVCRLAGTEISRVEDEWREHLGDSTFTALRDALVRLGEITDPPA
ncbi:MarR family winged helix-turn-helix transcriptional regulator [Mycolicibacterium vaccae]|uniref:MarR family winged helix-turn-helix transcriptional regulator n=1 Tax=Mycolicibacterium vaccae TaxID=1810 RepID=UPI003D057B97